MSQWLLAEQRSRVDRFCSSRCQKLFVMVVVVIVVVVVCVLFKRGCLWRRRMR